MNGLLTAVALGLLVFVIARALTRTVRLGERTFPDWGAVHRALVNDLQLPAVSLPRRGLAGAFFEGTRGDPERRARVQLRARDGAYELRFMIEAKDAPGLDVVPLTREAVPFADRYSIVHDDARAKRLLGQEHVRVAIDAIFGWRGVERLRVLDGWVVVTAGSDELPAPAYDLVLEELARVAFELERVALDVRVLSGLRVRAFRGANGRARCAYCHGDVTGDEPDLVACDLCATVAHEGCWAELGRCPVYGCDGRSRAGGTKGTPRRAPPQS